MELERRHDNEKEMENMACSLATASADIVAQKETFEKQLRMDQTSYTKRQADLESVLRVTHRETQQLQAQLRQDSTVVVEQARLFQEYEARCNLAEREISRLSAYSQSQTLATETAQQDARDAMALVSLKKKDMDSLHTRIHALEESNMALRCELSLKAAFDAEVRLAEASAAVMDASGSMPDMRLGTKGLFSKSQAILDDSVGVKISSMTSNPRHVSPAFAALSRSPLCAAQLNRDYRPVQSSGHASKSIAQLDREIEVLQQSLRGMVGL